MWRVPCQWSVSCVPSPGLVRWVRNNIGQGVDVLENFTFTFVCTKLYCDGWTDSKSIIHVWYHNAFLSIITSLSPYSLTFQLLLRWHIFQYSVRMSHPLTGNSLSISSSCTHTLTSTVSLWAVAEMAHLSAFCQDVTSQFTCTYALVVSTCAIHHLPAAKQLFGDRELAHMYLVIVLLAAPCVPGRCTTGDTLRICTTGK